MWSTNGISIILQEVNESQMLENSRSGLDIGQENQGIFCSENSSNRRGQKSYFCDSHGQTIFRTRSCGIILKLDKSKRKQRVEIEIKNRVEWLELRSVKRLIYRDIDRTMKLYDYLSTNQWCCSLRSINIKQKSINKLIKMKKIYRMKRITHNQLAFN